VDAAKVGLDLILGQVHGGRDDVRGHLAADLDEILAKVGLDRLDSVGFERRIEGQFLRHHGLALGDGPGADAAADVEHDCARLLGGDGEMHVAAGRRHAPFVGFEIKIEMRKRVVLDVARGIAQRVELGQLRRDVAPARGEIDLEEFQRLLQVRVAERGARVLLEARRGRLVRHVAALSRCGSPIAGP
jgi:hypothetical protein